MMSPNCLEEREPYRDSGSRKGGLKGAKIVPKDLYAQGMEKVVKTVVAELLSDEAERRVLLSDGQFGSRKKRSAIAAPAIMVHREHLALKDDIITGALLMDIKAAFPSLATGRVIHAMKAR
jgi:hypothetical protein